LSNWGTAVISFDLVSVGRRGDRQHQSLPASPGRDHVQGRLAPGPIKRPPQYFAVDGHHPLQLLGELAHEPLKRFAKRLRVQIAKQAIERIVAGESIGQSEKAAQKGLLGAGK